jgi:NAD dependent epimerase/dehydratase family enzyme
VFRCGLGGPLGSGRQVVSWISIDDALAAILRALRDDALAGPINVVAPHPVTSAELAATLGRVLGRPAVVRVPAAAIRLAFGEMGEVIALGGARVAPRRLCDAGFAFDDPTLEPHLRRVLGRPG